MPQYSNDYDAEFAPVIHGIRGLGTLVLQAPALRAQAQERVARAGLLNAETQKNVAEGQSHTSLAGKYDAETAGLNDEAASAKAIEDAAKRLSVNPDDRDAAASLFGATARSLATGKNPENAARGVATIKMFLDSVKVGGDAVKLATAARGGVGAAPNTLIGSGPGEGGRVVANAGQTIGDALGNTVMSGQMKLNPGQTGFGEQPSSNPDEVISGDPGSEPSIGDRFGKMAQGQPLPVKPAPVGPTPFNSAARMDTNEHNRLTGQLVSIDKAIAANMAKPRDGQTTSQWSALKAQRDQVAGQIASLRQAAGPGTNSPATVASPAAKPITADIAAQFLRQAGGNKDAARKLARDAGYAF